MPDLELLLLTLLLGFVTGVLSGMLGVGGAIISNPGLRAMGMAPLDVVGTTLPSIVPSSITGTIRYRRAGLVLGRVAVTAGLAGTLAAVGGALAAEHVPGDGHLLMLMVAAFMAFTAYRMVRAPASVIESHDIAQIDQRPWKVATIGVLAGGLSGLLGVGGGILMVPLFVTWLRMDVKRAVATSLACVGIFAIPGVITHALLGHVRWGFTIPLALGVVPGAWLGAQITIGAKERTVRAIIATALGIIAVVYGATELVALVGALT